MGFSFAISGMVVLGSTDRVIFSILAASIQGLIIFWPVMYGLREVAIAHPDIEYLFWWGWPIMNITTSILISIMAMWVMHVLPKKEQITLDERINRINKWFLNIFKKENNKEIKNKKV